MRVMPRSTARVTATLIPRSLNEPVGFAPSHLSQSSTSKRSDKRGAASSGVRPSPSVITRERLLGGEEIAGACQQQLRDLDGVECGALHQVVAAKEGHEPVLAG